MGDLDSHKALYTEFNRVWMEQEAKWKELFENRPMTTTGDNRYWHDREHIRFLVCIKFLDANKCSGLPVQQISMYICTRSGIQVRTHAQKYFKTTRINKPEVDEKVNLLLERDRTFLQGLFSQQKKGHQKKGSSM